MRKIVLMVTGGLLASSLTACNQPNVTGTDERPAAEAQAASGPASPSASPVRLQGYRFGTHATIPLGGAVADVVVESAEIRGRFIVVKIAMVSRSGTVDYTQFDWTVLAGDGTNLKQGSDPADLGSGVIPPGQKVTGTLRYEGGKDQLYAARVVYSRGGADLAYWVAPR